MANMFGWSTTLARARCRIGYNVGGCTMTDLSRVELADSQDATDDSAATHKGDVFDRHSEPSAVVLSRRAVYCVGERDQYSGDVVLFRNPNVRYSRSGKILSIFSTPLGLA